jgi:hypothetical protein
MYLGLFNKMHTFTNQLLMHRHPCVRVSSKKASCRPDHALRDRGSIVPTLYLCVSRTEALLMVSNTSYHKRLHDLHRFVYHIFASFVACKRLAVLAYDFGHEASILLCFI